MASGKEKGKVATAARRGVTLAGCQAHSPQRRQIDLPLLRSPRPAESHKVMNAREMVAGALTAVKCLLTNQPVIPQVSPLMMNESHIQEMKLE